MLLFHGSDQLWPIAQQIQYTTRLDPYTVFLPEYSKLTTENKTATAWSSSYSSHPHENSGETLCKNVRQTKTNRLPRIELSVVNPQEQCRSKHARVAGQGRWPSRGLSLVYLHLNSISHRIKKKHVFLNYFRYLYQ